MRNDGDRRCALAGNDLSAAMTAKTWTTSGFSKFSQGTCDNAGQNLYVSRAGVLQRIHQYDLDGDGYLDLIFCNSHDYWERPPAYVYPEPLSGKAPIELPSEGALTGVVTDLNGDGLDDLVLGMYSNGIRYDLNAIIYYGSSDGWSERYTLLLPAPLCTSVTAGDFNGDGRQDLAFLCQGKVRLFLQTDLGFEAKRYLDLPIYGLQLAADDLDGDGFTELIVREKGGSARIYWGGVDGIDPSRVTEISIPDEIGYFSYQELAELDSGEYIEPVMPLLHVIRLAGCPHLYLAGADAAALLPVTANRRFQTPLIFHCRTSLSVALADINGDGYPDLVFACQETTSEGDGSWIYRGGADGFSESRRTFLPGDLVCDVAVGDLDDDGNMEIVLCRHHTDEQFSTPALIYRATPDGITRLPVELPAHDARRIFLATPSGGQPRQVVLVNRYSGSVRGRMPAYLYAGGPDGYAPDRRRELPAWGAVEAICADFNDDGRVDIVLANAAENAVMMAPSSYVLLQGPEGFPDAPSQELPTVRAHGVCCADLNHDGYLDLVFAGFNNPEIVIFHGTSQGFDIEHPERIRLEYDGVVYKEPRWIYLADLTNNGWLDLVIPLSSDDRSLILWGGPEGFSIKRCRALSVQAATSVRAIDLTGNGYLDLLLGGHAPSLEGPHDSFVYIYWNGPDGLREERRMQLPAKAINSMSIADFNNDGLPDLFICSYHDGRERDLDSYIYWQRPGRGFSAADRTLLRTHSASGCFAADLNENGWIDLVVANHKLDGRHDGESCIWWNGPDGFSEARTTRLPSLGPHGMRAVEPGNIMDRRPEEYYLSSPFRLPEDAVVTHMTWEAHIPAKTWVRAQLRHAASVEELVSARWLGSTGEDSWYEQGKEITNLPTGPCWMQYRLALGAINSLTTPRVTRVDVHYFNSAITDSV